MIVISACLVGENCTYRGDSNETNWVKDLYYKEECLLVCPEVMGDLPTPRMPAEIVSFDPLKVETLDKQDVTQAFLFGAKNAWDKIKDYKIDAAILKSNSPSCGYQFVYDGYFSHQLVNHSGIFASLLEKQSIPIFTEKDEKNFQDFYQNKQKK